jgi:hypothetical protein
VVDGADGLPPSNKTFMMGSGSGWTSTGYRPVPGIGTNAFALRYELFVKRFYAYRCAEDYA